MEKDMPPPHLPTQPVTKALFIQAKNELKATGPKKAYQFVANPAISAVVEQACDRQEKFFLGMKELLGVATEVETFAAAKDKIKLATLTPRLKTLEAASRAEAAQIARWGPGTGNTVSAFANEIEAIRPKAGDFTKPEATSIKKMLSLLSEIAKWNRLSAKDAIGDAEKYVDPILAKAKAVAGV